MAERLILGTIIHYVLPATIRKLRSEGVGKPMTLEDEPNPEAGEHRAALVVGFPDGEDPDRVNLMVFHNRPEMEFVDGAPYSARWDPGTWHLSERDETSCSWR